MFNQVVINISISVSVFLLIACSYSVIYYSTKIFHLAHAVVITSGAYLTFFSLNKLFLPFSVAIIFAIMGATILGIACELVVYSYLRRKNLPVFSYLIASIGLYIVFQNLISAYFGDNTKIINTAQVTLGHQIWGAYITTIEIVTIVVSISLFILVNLFLKYTTAGKSIRAVASNPELCNIYGISSNRVILIAFGIGSALAAMAGILSAMDTNMTPTFGFGLLLYGIVAMIIGGVGSMRGLVAGAILVASAQHLIAFYIDTKWMDAITYIILILFLIWKPLGFSGNRLKKVEV